MSEKLNTSQTKPTSGQFEVTRAVWSFSEKSAEDSKSPDLDDESRVPFRSETVEEARAEIDAILDSTTSVDLNTNYAEKLGISEQSLNKLILGLNMDGTPLNQRSRLLGFIREHTLDMGHDELFTIVKEYQRDKVKASEKGELLHYHQTKLENLDSILDNGGLFSHNIQKELGIAGNKSGSRPDAVQFTRDHYDKEGNLTEPGLVSNNTIGVYGDLAFVFNQEVMDTPGYDCIVRYPNVPSVSTDLLRAAVVADPQNVALVASLLAQHNITAEVVTRDAWPDKMSQIKPSTASPETAQI